MITVSRNDARHRYEGRIGDEVVTVVQYTHRDDVVDIVHIRTALRWRGQGLAGKVTAAALDDIRAGGWKVRPTCPYAASFLSHHPEYEELRA